MAREEPIVSGMAGRYATALFELAEESGAIEAVSGDLDRFEKLLADSDDLRRLVKSPMFGAEVQRRALDTILAQAGIGGLAAKFLDRVAANRRLFAVEQILRAFRARVAQYRGEVRAQVRVAEPLAERHQASLQEALNSVTGKQVTIDVTVDPALLGGLVVKLGSRMLDASLRTKLNALRHVMKEVG